MHCFQYNVFESIVVWYSTLELCALFNGLIPLGPSQCQHQDCDVRRTQLRLYTVLLHILR